MFKNHSLLSLKESEPVSYPVVAGLSIEAAAIDPAIIWRRIESYIVYRFCPRIVVLSARDISIGVFPLAPAEIISCETWNGNAWEEYTLPAAPFGPVFPIGNVRVTATVGNTVVPADVSEAYRRMAEYLSAEDAVSVPGASRYSINLGRVEETISRRADHTANAMVNSGAADMLRPYRFLS